METKYTSRLFLVHVKYSILYIRDLYRSFHLGKNVHLFPHQHIQINQGG